MRASLRDDAGVLIPIETGGVLLGRSNACSIVIDDVEVSRRHVIVLVSGGEVLALPLAKAGVVVDGKEVDTVTPMTRGSVLVVGPSRFVLEVSDVDEPTWLLAVGTRKYPVTNRAFVIGGDPSDDLCIASWPPHACTLYAVEGGLVLETSDPRIECAGVTTDGDDERSSFLEPNARFRRGEVEIELVTVEGDAPTAQRVSLPREVAFEFVPNGALLHVKLSDVHTIFLPHVRASLVATLLDPGAGLRAGDWIPDSLLVPRVWGRVGATGKQVNVLIHRTRHSLSTGGLGGPQLVERAPGGGATRFQLAPGAQVTVR